MERSESQRKYYDGNKVAIMSAQRKRRNTIRHNGLRTVYCAGKMTGLPGLGFDKFDAARDKLQREGWLVYSPADNDRKNGFDPDADTVETSPSQYSEMFRWDIARLLEADAIYMLSNWRDSEGAITEHRIAKAIGLDIMYEGRDATRGASLSDAEASQ